MPTSFQFFKQEVRDYIVDNVDINKKILDVGAGIGTYSDMLKNYGYYMDCVEIYGPYVSNYQLDKKYNNVFIQSVVGFHFDYYEFIIMGDVLEHLSVEDAQSIIRKIVPAVSNAWWQCHILWNRESMKVTSMKHICSNRRKYAKSSCIIR